MSVTPNMNITLPTPEVTTGPEWANQLVDAFDNVDEHDHTVGKGVKVPTAGLNINADLEFNNNNAIELRSSRYTNHLSTLTDLLDKNCVYFSNGDLYINNNAGVSIQLTAGNAINLSTVGTIGGDYGQPGVSASASYSNSTKTFNWTQAPTQAAKMSVGDLLIYETTAGATPITIKSSSGVVVGYNFWLPQSAPTANQLWRQNNTNNGANFVTIQGTNNQITITHAASTITAALSSTLVAPGTLSSTGNFDVATNKFTVNSTSGNTAVAGTLAITGNVSVATNKFTVDAYNGNTVVAGTLAAASDLAIATNKFTVAAATGNTAVAGTLAVTSNLTADKITAGGQIGSEVSTTASSGASLAINWNTANIHRITLTDNCTFTFSNPVAGFSYVLILTQDGTGNRLVNWPSIKWRGASAPTLSTAGGTTDVISLLYDGVDYYGGASLSFNY